MSRQTSVQRFISNYPRKSNEIVEEKSSITVKPSVYNYIWNRMSNLSNRTNITAARMVSIDRQADEQNIDHFETVTLESATRNVKYLRLNYDNLKRDSDKIELEIKKITQEIDYYKERCIIIDNL